MQTWVDLSQALRLQTMIRLVKFLLLIFLLPSTRVFADLSYELGVDFVAMEDDWSVLPSTPASFESARGTGIFFKLDYDMFGFQIDHDRLNLNLQRVVEPLDVSLSAHKDSFLIFYRLSDVTRVSFHLSQQIADPQRFECYYSAGITIGSCENSNVQVGSLNPKYDFLNGDLIAINADTESFGITISRSSDRKWLDSLSVGIFSTTHKYDWSTPLEDLVSPYILELVFNGNKLGDAIAEVLRKFPQRDSWRLNQLNVSVNKAVSLYGPIEAFANADFVYLHHSNYRNINYEPTYNIKFRSGLRFERRSLLIEVYGNYYHHNLIGFEPITFNQRTEHRFDEPYGNLGSRVEFRF